ncbi:hypothetical protein FBR02_07040 [Anaerolineae bacterium CFX9]|nr:hypothetical protein [Anaerolineae bacterium CFX9]
MWKSLSKRRMRPMRTLPPAKNPVPSLRSPLPTSHRTKGHPMNLVIAITIGTLFGLGVYQLLRRDLIKAAMGFALLFTAVNLLLLAVGAFDGLNPAYTDQGERPSDPLVQALILTAIVVSFGSYALLLGLVNVVSTRFSTLKTDDVSQLQK